MRLGRRCRALALLMTVLLLCISNSNGTRTMFQLDSSSASNSNSTSSSNEAQAPPIPEEHIDLGLNDTAKLVAKQFGNAFKTLEEKNITMKDLMPKNISFPTIPEIVNFTISHIKDAKLASGMTAVQVLKAFMTGTISSNTADTNTPDKGLSDVQSGALNVRPFIDGASMSNALTLAGRDATANSRGIVFGLTGTGRSSSQATAVGRTGAKSSTDTFVINGGGLNQNAMGSNLAITPQGAADTSVRSAAFNIIGGTYTGGLPTAIGKKGADSAGLAAGMTGLGDSYSSQFSNSLAEGKTSSSTGVIAGTLTGQAKGTVGSVATSAKSSSDTQALSTSKAGLGSSTSKSASLSTAAKNATSHSGSDSFSAVGNSASISSTTSRGMNADSSASSKAKSEAGAANSVSVSKSFGVTSASASSNSTSLPSRSGIRMTPLLRLQLKLPSTTFSSSKSRSSTFHGTGRSGPLPDFLPPLPVLFPHPGSDGPDLTMPLLAEALLTNAGLKALLPSVPKIIPQLPTLNQTVQVDAAPACNETELNANRTAEQKWLSCNATDNSTAPSPPPMNLPGLSFFDNLKKMNADFMKENTKPSPSPSPSPQPAHKPESNAKKPSNSSSTGQGSKTGSNKGGGTGSNSGSNQRQGSGSPSKPGEKPGNGTAAIKQSLKPSPKPSASPKPIL